MKSFDRNEDGVTSTALNSGNDIDDKSNVIHNKFDSKCFISDTIVRNAFYISD